jgi:hypothetical protein
MPRVSAGDAPPADLRPPLGDAAASFIRQRLPSVASSVSSDGICIVIRPLEPGRVVNIVGVRSVL